MSSPGGHSIDSRCWMLGEYEKLSATVKTAVTEVEVVGTTGERIKRTSADQILVAGELKSGVVASVRLSGASSPGTGIRLEIKGDDGDPVIQAEIGRASRKERVCQDVEISGGAGTLKKK